MIRMTEPNALVRESPCQDPMSLSNNALVGRPSLDLGTLGAILSDPGTFLDVQICWSNEVGRSPTFSEVSPSLISWLDEWLDKSSYSGVANVRFETSDGQVIQLRFGED